MPRSRRGTLALLLCSAGTSLGAAQPKELVSKDGGFAVVMPCEPSYETTPVDTAQGRIVVHAYSCQATGFYAMVTYVQASDLSGDPEERLDNTRDGAIGRLRGGKLIAEEKISVGGHPGRAIRAEGINNQLAVSRFILVQKENRLFTILAGANKTSAPEKEIQKFMGSFRLLGK